MGLEGLACLCGKLLTDLSASEDRGMFHRGMETLLNAREAMIAGKEQFPQKSPYTVDPSRPSEWVSFDGEIKSPLYLQRSAIPNAGQGLHTRKAIKKGDTIAPSRVKVANTGTFLDDWRKFPVAAMTNHHPIPNMDIVRAEAPLGTHPSMGETCYFVANRDIAPDEELTSDYRDKGWAEYDYFEHIPLPYEEWDRGALSTLANPPTLLQTISEKPDDYMVPLGLGGGAVLVCASRYTSGLLSPVLGVGGLLWTGYALWKSDGH